MSHPSRPLLYRARSERLEKVPSGAEAPVSKFGLWARVNSSPALLLKKDAIEWGTIDCVGYRPNARGIQEGKMRRSLNGLVASFFVLAFVFGTVESATAALRAGAARVDITPRANPSNPDRKSTRLNSSHLGIS